MLLFVFLFPSVASADEKPYLGVFKGKWGITDGACIIQADGIKPDSHIDVKYLNPKEINISEISLSVQKGLLKLFIKLEDEEYIVRL